MKSTNMTDKPSVSILKETRDNEKRVIMLPQGVRQFVEAGFKVYVEHDAGAASGAFDGDYKAAGGEIVSTDEAWTVSPFLLKYKFPSVAERRYLCRPLHIGAYFYPGENYELTHHLREHGVTAYSFEYFQAVDGSFPLMTPDSEISGKLAVLFGAHHLLSTQGGLGIMLASLPGMKPPKVVVIGHGNVGAAAARTAAGLGNEVVVFGYREESLRRFEATVPSNVKCLIVSQEALEREIPDADLVIGATLISTYDTPAMLTDELVKKMKEGSMIIDVTCGYGAGYIPTAHTFTWMGAAPYKVHGVWHYKDPVMPAHVHQTASIGATTNHTRYLISLGKSIFLKDFQDSVSQKGKFVENGEIIHPHVISDFALIEALAKKSA
ncbi:NAD-binding protein [Mesorhizobium sp. M0902]|uniref:NAD(P)-dependent oxidoreductase n=1 Tax=Mesorhizobium sp. M0902 TaxID=2957021 RepID=UPI003339A0E2